MTLRVAQIDGPSVRVGSNTQLVFAGEDALERVAAYVRGFLPIAQRFSA
jgi:hypothetical protein